MPISSSNIDKTILDWDACIVRANQKSELAKQLLALFVQELPGLLKKIETSFKEKDEQTLRDVLHRLISGTSYCVVPQFLKTADIFKTHLKEQGMDSNILKKDYCMLMQAGEQIILYYKKIYNDLY